MPKHPLTLRELLAKLSSLNEEQLSRPAKMITRDHRRFYLSLASIDIPETVPLPVVEGYTVYGVSES